ncbi:MAG: hypothetical protein ABSB86_16650 [Bryobacteraceae bacterium]
MSVKLTLGGDTAMGATTFTITLKVTPVVGVMTAAVPECSPTARPETTAGFSATLSVAVLSTNVPLDGVILTKSPLSELKVMVKEPEPPVTVSVCAAGMVAAPWATANFTGLGEKVSVVATAVLAEPV